MGLVKKICTTAILALIFTLSIANFVSAAPIELSAEERILSFLTDVIKIDVTKYSVTINIAVVYPSDLGGLPEET